MMQGGACGAVPGIRAQFAVPRNVYILVFNSPLFPAHWCFWIPHADNTDVGKRIHASGDASNGFTIVFERNYDLRNTERRHQVVPLAQVLDHYVVDVKGNGSPSTDNTAYDYLEQVALSVPAPAGSLVSASTPGPMNRVNIQNCQTWLRQVVAALVHAGVMGEAALQIVDSTPRN